MKQSYLYMLSNMMPCQLEKELKKWEQKAKLNPDIAENREAILCIEGLIKKRGHLLKQKYTKCDYIVA